MPKRLTPRGEAAPPVEPNIAQAAIPRKPAQRKRQTKISDKPGVKYVRNIRGIECRFTLQDGKGRRIGLAPRGQRGDIEIVNKEDQEDPIYLANEGLLFEVITAAEAKRIIANQQINAREEEHPIWSQLRNEKGQGYQQRHATIEESIESKAIVVADIKEAGAGRFTDKNVQEVRRGAGPMFIEAPGSAGHPATGYMQSVPGDISPEDYHDFLLWKQFMAQRNAATPDVDDLEVTIAPTETEDESSD